MAEGGIAAAVGSMDSRDNWKVHFKDTMFGGKYVNNWRMAEMHAKEAPEEIENLERWGAVFDRNERGGIMQRIFGGHTYQRLVQVGDRTGLELIRTLQDRAVAGKLEVYMEHTVTALLRERRRVSARRLRAAVGRSDAVAGRRGVIVAAASDGSTRSPRIRGKARPTAIGSRSTPAPN